MHGTGLATGGHAGVATSVRTTETMRALLFPRRPRKGQGGRGIWCPPSRMRARDASLPKKTTGGVHNPLGTIALYLGNAEYRIHGTNDTKPIGRAQSSGCLRMLNSAAP